MWGWLGIEAVFATGAFFYVEIFFVHFLLFCLVQSARLAVAHAAQSAILHAGQRSVCSSCLPSLTESRTPPVPGKPLGADRSLRPPPCLAPAALQCSSASLTWRWPTSSTSSAKLALSWRPACWRGACTS
jgi:hypothetical protein